MTHSPQALEAAARFDAQATDIGNAPSIELENVDLMRRILIAQRELVDATPFSEADRALLYAAIDRLSAVIENKVQGVPSWD